MRAKDRLMELERRKQEIISFTSGLDGQLREGELNQIEYAILLHENFKGQGKEELISELDEQISELSSQLEKEQKAKFHIGIAGAAIIIIAIISLFSQYAPFSPTGFVIGPRQTSEIISYNNEFATSAETVLEVANITGLSISGSLVGTKATVKLRIGEVDYLVGQITPTTQDSLITGMAIEEETSGYAITTDKASYALGETVTITIAPEAQDKSVYIAFEEETGRLDDGVNTYEPAAAGEYQAIALIVLPDDIVRVEADFVVTEAAVGEQAQEEPVIEEPGPAEEPLAEQDPVIETTGFEFTNICVETCSLEETNNPTLIIELEGDSKLTITELIITRERENSAPEQSQQIPDIAITTGQIATLILDSYFTDSDGDTLQYDLNDISEVNAEISQSELSMLSDTPGVYIGYIYATDGDKLVTSNTFTITVTEIEGNEDTSPTTSVPETGDVPVIPVPSETIGPCANADPNLRPPECMEGKEEQYFVVESVFLKDSSRANAARITPLGNLMIKGVLVENSDMNPGENDFKVTYMDADYNDVPVAWISSDTGDLYIKGKLYEEEFFLQPTPNAFVIQNKRNINLAYIDRSTGDLHIKGNLVQMRENVE